MIPSESVGYLTCHPEGGRSLLCVFRFPRVPEVILRFFDILDIHIELNDELDSRVAIFIPLGNGFATARSDSNSSVISARVKTESRLPCLLETAALLALSIDITNELWHDLPEIERIINIERRDNIE